MTDERLLPPLTVMEASDLVREMEKALAAHRRWFNRFHVLLVCRGRPRPTDLAREAHLRCGLGRWLDRASAEYLVHNPYFEAVLDSHRRVHAGASRMAARLRDGGTITPARYTAFAENSRSLKQAARGLLADARGLLRNSDPLTGIANRFAMLPRMEEERHRVARIDQPCSISMVDIDHFKSVNDTHGHAVGDLVLRQVAEHLLDHLRRYDQVCRYGGEEFLIMLPDTAPEKAKRVLDRIRRGLKRKRMEIGNGRHLGVTASFGIAPLLPHRTLMTAIDRADKAMYAAKREGRNKVHVWLSKVEKKKKKAGKKKKGKAKG